MKKREKTRIRDIQNTKKDIAALQHKVDNPPQVENAEELIAQMVCAVLPLNIRDVLIVTAFRGRFDSRVARLLRSKETCKIDSALAFKRSLSTRWSWRVPAASKQILFYT